MPFGPFKPRQQFTVIRVEMRCLFPTFIVVSLASVLVSIPSGHQISAVNQILAHSSTLPDSLPSIRKSQSLSNRAHYSARMDSNTPIKDFMAQYAFDDYVAVAKVAEEACRKALGTAKIPAIITSRAKDAKRLRDKLDNRNKLKPYGSVADIQKDLVDLVGIRVALYIPDQVYDAMKVLAGPDTVGGPLKQVPQAQGGVIPTSLPFVFKDLKDKKIHGSLEGYQATHLRVTLDKTVQSQLESTNSAKGTVVEIQFQSVVMHSWAEVTHDLDYKTLNGELSKTEKDMIAGLNKHMREAEKMINAIHEATKERLKNDKPSLPKYNFYGDAKHTGDDGDMGDVD